jgi:hypothetical protein
MHSASWRPSGQSPNQKDELLLDLQKTLEEISHMIEELREHYSGSVTKRNSMIGQLMNDKLRRDSRSSHVRISSGNSEDNVTGCFLTLLQKLFHRSRKSLTGILIWAAMILRAPTSPSVKRMGDH